MTDRPATDGTTELPDFICVDYGTKQLMVPWKPLIEALSKATPAQQEAVRCAVTTGWVARMVLRLESERDVALSAQQSAERELEQTRRNLDDMTDDYCKAEKEAERVRPLAAAVREAQLWLAQEETRAGVLNTPWQTIRARQVLVDALRALDAASEGEKTHPQYGPCDAFGPDGSCTECELVRIDALSDEQLLTEAEARGVTEKEKDERIRVLEATIESQLENIKLLRERITELEKQAKP